MCKSVLATGFALMLIAFTVGIASAQPHPFIAAYFDDNYQIEASPVAPDPCPGIGQIGYLYVMLVNANAWVSAVEFRIIYPAAITWLADLDLQPVAIGSTPTGLSMGWSIPQNGFPGPGKPYGGIRICRVLFQWNCNACVDPYVDNEIKVVKHPSSPAVGPRYTDFPAIVLYDALGLTSLICATIPAEESTWGKVKSLYSE